PAVHVSVDVSGARRLAICTVVEEGSGNCNIWGDAKLIAKDKSETLLATLKPVVVEVGYGDLYAGHNWQNHSLRIRGQKFEHGLWVHAPSTIGYALDGK